MGEVFQICSLRIVIDKSGVRQRIVSLLDTLFNKILATCLHCVILLPLVREHEVVLFNKSFLGLHAIGVPGV